MMAATQQWYVRAKEVFSRDSEAWGVSPRQARLLLLIPFIIAVTVAATLPFRELYLWLLDEDHLIEWLQFLCLVGASIFLPLIALHLVRTKRWGMALLYAAVTLAVVFLAGEEISWGQRIFDWTTPEAMAEVNRQGETSLHNIRGVQELVPAAMLLASLYGACAPLMWAAVGKRREGLRSWRLLVPPLCLVPAFLLPAGYRLFRLLIWPEPTFVISEYAEAMELSLYFALAMFCCFSLRLLRQPRPVLRDLPSRVHRRAM
jgi:hypothetical protein